MFHGLSPTHRLLVVVLLLGVCAVLLAHVHIGLPGALLVSLVICVFLWVTKVVWLPSSFGTTKVRLLSLAGIFAIAGSYGVWAPLVDPFITEFLKSPDLLAKYPWLKNVSIRPEPSLAIQVFVLLGIFIVNYLLPDRTISGQHPTPVDEEFPEKGYLEKRNAFCSTLERHLTALDVESNWSPEYYTPLDADVEVRSRSPRVTGKRVMDLLSALRPDKRSQGFLVLGDPGSGKSVALRKLTLHMLREVPHTGRVPIYVNLREWLPHYSVTTGVANTVQWTEAKPPTINDIYEFVVANVKARGDIFTVEFVEKYFKKMWEHGRLFFVLDSFDEIPQLLDVGEGSWLIEHLSQLLWTFIAGTPLSRGVLATRFFRRPSEAFFAPKLLEIRPLSEEKIIHALGRFSRFDSTLSKQFFRERSDLVPIARNPFLMALLGTWVQERGSLPETQAQMYESYLRGRLARCSERMARYGVDTDEVLTTAQDIAYFIFDSKDYGLEAPVSAISNGSSIRGHEAVMDILNYGRIGRFSIGDSKSFGFVHRRFLEYFVAQKLVASPTVVPLDDIPTDSRGRDAMVLFAEIATPEEATRLARFCWSQITENFGRTATRMRAVHSLRFLADAFRARKECIESFEAELAQFVERGISENEHLLIAKLCLEATGLLQEDRVESILKKAISQRNGWLQETALKACRHIPRLSPTLEQAVGSHLWRLPITVYWKASRDLLFSLSLSEGLSRVLTIARARLWDVRFYFAGLVALAVARPGQSVLIGLVGMLCGTLVLLPSENPSKPSMSNRAHVPFLEDFVIPIRLYERPLLNASLAFVRLFLLGFCVTYPIVFVLKSMAFLQEIRIQGMPLTEIAQTLDSWMQLSLVSPDYLVWLLIVGFALVVPWLALVGRWDMLATATRSMKSYGWKLIGSIGLFVIGIFFALFIAYWLHELMPKFYWIVISYVGFAIIGIGCLTLACVLARKRFRDWRKFRHVEIHERMKRSDIVQALGRLTTDKYRMCFISLLSDRRVVATGDWPDGFSLNARLDPAITDLAKLEERWLGLDR